MKKKSLLKGLLVSFMLLCATLTWAYDFEVDNIQYTVLSLEDLTVEVSGLTDTNVTEVIIPETVEYKSRTLDVISIGEKAFQKNKTLQSISMSSIVTIGRYAFDECTALTDVVIPNSVESIGYCAFGSCTKLVDITIPNSVTSIGSYAFSGCTKLVDITIPNSVTSIGSYAFYKCSSLTEVTIGNSVTSIADYTFYYCSSLTEIIIPNSVTSIGSYAFRECSSLTEVTIGNSVTSIGSSAFYHCSSLNEITIPNSVTSIGGSAFYQCYSLRNVDISDSVTKIGSNAFYYCYGIESFSIGAGIERLMDHENPVYTNYPSNGGTYYPLLWRGGPSQVKSIVLKDGPSSLSVTGYGYHYSGASDEGYPIFSNMYVENYYVGRPLTDIKNWTYTTSSYSLNFSISVSQPYGTIGTLEIGGYCTDVPYFYQSIANLILGEDVETYTVKNIYQGELASITCKSTTPPALTGTFDTSTYVNTVLYVPKGCKTTYESTEGWKDFWDIIEADVSGIDDIVNSGEVTEVARYTVSGQKINTPQKGINIIRYSDGTTRKILVQ